MAELKGVLVDTDILIDISRNKPRAVDFFDNLSKENPPIFISVISAMELMVGARNKKEVGEIENFLAAYQLLPLTARVSYKAYELIKRYAKSHGLEIPDALIAASAISSTLYLATTNKKHFSRIKDLQSIETY